MIWLHGIALLGLAAVAVALLAHVVARSPSTRVVFPTLRFLGDAPLQLRASRSLRDWPLLLVRMAIVACAALALAEPVFLLPARVRQANTRHVRAIVIDTSSSMARVARESTVPAIDLARARAAEVVTVSHRAAVFEGDALTDSIRRARRWLETAPPGRRQMVVYTDAHIGALSGAAFAEIPPHVGVEIHVVDVIEPDAIVAGTRAVGDRLDRRTESMMATRQDDGERPLLHADALPASSPCALPVSVEAPAPTRLLADAAREAVVAAGVPCASPDSRGVVVSFTNASTAPTSSAMTPSMLAVAARILDALPPADGHALAWARRGDDLVVHAAVEPSSDASLRVISAAFAATADPQRRQELEPRRESDAVLALWRRLPADVPLDAFRHAGTSDGRVLWALCLAMLAIETWVRRQPPGRAAAAREDDRAA